VAGRQLSKLHKLCSVHNHDCVTASSASDLQMLCGIAKDLTKLGGKTVTKLVTGDEKQTRLFKLVSLNHHWLEEQPQGPGLLPGWVARCLVCSRLCPVLCSP
jgi:hypothetical protein